MQRPPGQTDVRLYLLVLIPVTFVIVGQTLAKLGTQDVKTLADAINVPIIAGFVLLTARAFIWIFIARYVNVSVAFPMMSMTYVFILIVSHFVFAEPVTRPQLGGTALIVMGVACLSLGEAKYTDQENR